MERMDWFALSTTSFFLDTSLVGIFSVFLQVFHQAFDGPDGFFCRSGDVSEEFDERGVDISATVWIGLKLRMTIETEGFDGAKRAKKVASEGRERDFRNFTRVSGENCAVSVASLKKVVEDLRSLRQGRTTRAEKKRLDERIQS